MVAAKVDDNGRRFDAFNLNGEDVLLENLLGKREVKNVVGKYNYQGYKLTVTE